METPGQNPAGSEEKRINYKNTIPMSGDDWLYGDDSPDPTEGFVITNYEHVGELYGGYRRYQMHEEGKEENVRDIAVPHTEGPMEHLQPLDQYELSEFDQDVIEQGTKRLLNFLKSKKELPTLLIFPDTSARPLFWALSAGLKEVYGQKSQVIPKICFLRLDEVLLLHRKENEDLLRQDDYDGAKHNQELLDRQIKRLKEEGLLNGDTSLMVVDDFASVDKKSYRIIGGALKQDLKPGNFTWFSYLGNPDAEEEEDMIIALRDTRKTPGIIRNGLDFTSGRIVRSNVSGVDKRTAPWEIDKNITPQETNFSRVLQDKTEINRTITVGIRKKMKEIGKKVASALK